MHSQGWTDNTVRAVWRRLLCWSWHGTCYGGGRRLSRCRRGPAPIMQPGRRHFDEEWRRLLCGDGAVGRHAPQALGPHTLYSMGQAGTQVPHSGVLVYADTSSRHAGIMPAGSVLTQTIEEWDQVMAINLKGRFLCARGTLPGLRRRGVRDRLVPLRRRRPVHRQRESDMKVCAIPVRWVCHGAPGPPTAV
jgi:hypothetical protein